MYIYGKNVVIEYLKNNKKIINVYLYKKFNDKIIINELKKRNININWLEKHELDKLVNKTHQGIILKVDSYKYEPLHKLINKKNAIIVILDHIEDPHNFGAIIRTCEAAGVDGIIIPKDRSVSVNSTVIKVSTGAIENIPISQVVNISRTIRELKDNGYWIIGTDMDGVDFEEIDYGGSIAIVIGNEGRGLSRIVKEQCDFIASIPMFGKVNSLNASVATGIIVYKAKMSRR